MSSAPGIYTQLEYEELRGFARSMAELQWLLLILVILYFFIPTGPVTDADTVIGIMVSYAGFVLLIRYLGFQSRETRLKLAIETWAMIAFITSILWHTGMVESPLLNLYLLVIIACAITLGKLITILEVFLIAGFYMYMGFQMYSVDIFAAGTFTTLMARFSPFLLVAYVTSMLASDIISARKKLIRLSQTDELTGLLNLRAFNKLLEKEFARAERNKESFTIVMIDIDNLKKINDSYGHSAGSRLMQGVARAIKGCIRSYDVLARYGGDEFVLLLPGTTSEHAQLCAERICTAISNTSLDSGGYRISTTASIGIASFPNNAPDAQQVLDKADMALYRSKLEGRNRVTWYDPAPETALAGT